MSNLSDLLQVLSLDQGKAVTTAAGILGGAIGLTADVSAAVDIIEGLLSDNASVQDVLNTITTDFNKINAILSASDKLQRMRDIDQGINPAVTVFQQLPAILASVPPVTQDFKLAQIQTCTQAVLFFSNYDDKWQVVQADSPYYSDEWSGTLAAPAGSPPIPASHLHSIDYRQRAGSFEPERVCRHFDSCARASHDCS
jgi:hypothetical protein